MKRQPTTVPDPERDAEMEAIGHMLSKASERGLLAEVIWTYGDTRAIGIKTTQACEAALYEWDI